MSDEVTKALPTGELIAPADVSPSGKLEKIKNLPDWLQITLTAFKKAAALSNPSDWHVYESAVTSFILHHLADILSVWGVTLYVVDERNIRAVAIYNYSLDDQAITALVKRLQNLEVGSPESVIGCFTMSAEYYKNSFANPPFKVEQRQNLLTTLIPSVAELPDRLKGSVLQATQTKNASMILVRHAKTAPSSSFGLSIQIVEPYRILTESDFETVCQQTPFLFEALLDFMNFCRQHAEHQKKIALRKRSKLEKIFTACRLLIRAFKG